MAAPPTSLGYPGAVNAKLLPSWLVPVAAARFSVGGRDDWKVSVEPNLDRGIRINAGTIIGDGILDVFPDYDTRSLPIPSGTSQWFLIAAKRSWSTPYTTNLVVIPGTSEKKIPTHTNAPGAESHQQIALVRVAANSTVVQEIVDLRAWAGNGGVEAADMMGLEQLARPGAAVKIGTATNRYEYQAANGGEWAWRLYPTVTVLFDGTSSDNPWMQPFLRTVNVDGNGAAAVPFGTPFPRRIVGATLTQVHQTTLGRVDIRYSEALSNTSRAAFLVYDNAGNLLRNLQGLRLSGFAWGD